MEMKKDCYFCNEKHGGTFYISFCNYCEQDIHSVFSSVEGSIEICERCSCEGCKKYISKKDAFQAIKNIVDNRAED